MKALGWTLGVFGMILMFSLPQPIFATCMPMYGGGESCTNPPTLTIEKSVLNPATNTYVHDMGINDVRFHGGDTVTFHIVVTNTGGSTTNGSVVVTDVLPNFIASSNPAFDKVTSSVTFDAGVMNPGQSENFTVTATLADASTWPSNATVFCLNNQGIAQTNDNRMGEDFSQFCVEKTTTISSGSPTTTILLTPTLAPYVTGTNPTVYPPPPVSTLPPTGAELLPIIGMIPIGLFMRSLGAKGLQKSQRSQR